MKKTIFLLALAICTGSLFAQNIDSASAGNNNLDNTTNVGGPARANHSKMDKMKDGFYMKDGTVWQVMNGQKMTLTQDKTLNNGAILKTDGTIKMSDGSTKTLKNGQYVDMDGNISTSHRAKTDNNAGGR